MRTHLYRRPRNRRRSALVALLVAAAVAAGTVAVTANGAGAANACYTASSPFAGASVRAVSGSMGRYMVRQYSKRGLSPMYIASIDLRHTSLGPVLPSAVTQRKQVRSMMGRALVATNGDYFHTYTGSNGLEVARGGRLIKGTASFGRALVTRPDQTATVADVRGIIHVNRKTGDRRQPYVTASVAVYNNATSYPNSVAVYDNLWGDGRLLRGIRFAAQPTWTVVVAAGHVRAIHSGAWAGPIPPGGFLAIVNGDARATVQQMGWRMGAALSISKAVQSNTERHVWAASGGGYTQFQHGQVQGWVCGYDARTPRTTWAIDRTGTHLWGIVASGQGLTMREMTAVIRSLGATDSIMFDGGGSSVMTVVHGRQLTVHPYKIEGDRPVPNGVGVWVR